MKMKMRTVVALTIGISVGCGSMFKKSPARVAADDRRANLAFPCLNESKAAEAKIDDMSKKGNPATDIDWTWQCKNGDSPTWYVKFAAKNGADLAATEDLEGGGTKVWSGAADGQDVVMQVPTKVIDQNGVGVDAKNVVTLTHNGQTLEGTMNRSIGWAQQPAERAWTCEQVKVTCTR